MHIGINAHLLSGKSGYRTAGIHGYIHNLLTHLAAATPPDWKLTVMAGQQTQTDYPGIEMRRSRWNTERPLTRILWEQAIQPFQISDFDLYHAMAFVSPLLLTKPSVVTVYDLSFVHYPQVLTAARRLYLQLFTRLSCQRARRVIAISHSTARDVESTFGLSPDKIDVAACGYDTERFKPLDKRDVAAFKQQHNLPDRFWLFIGTLEPRKNLPTLLKAYAALPRQERLPLILAGGRGWMMDEIDQTIEQYGLKDDVHFPGFVPAQDLALWYNSAEVFIYPSVFEGFGLPILEAMACGTPVILSDASSLPEVAGNSGLQLDPYDIPQWTQALHRAFYDDEWREQTRNLGFQEAQRYRWSSTAQATIASYRQALESRPK
jgi:glycosyltransferase involved in cell wall biosynthesis